MPDDPRRRVRRFQIARHVVATFAECWAIAEIVYYTTHDGDTLHGAVVDRYRQFREHAEERAIFQRKLKEIRDLPETRNRSNRSNG